jgi:hypothetical protein
MDEDKKIEALVKLIPSARGNYERLLQLTEQLSTLLWKAINEQKTRQHQLDQTERTIEPPLEEPLSLPVHENLKGVTIVKITSKDLFDLFFDSDGVADFMNRCVDYINTKIIKQDVVLKLIRVKCYVQLKITFEFYHDKPYEPTFKSVKKPFYIDKVIQRSNLVQSVDEFKSIVINQSRDILHMVDRFENNGSG